MVVIVDGTICFDSYPPTFMWGAWKWRIMSDGKVWYLFLPTVRAWISGLTRGTGAAELAHGEKPRHRTEVDARR